MCNVKSNNFKVIQLNLEYGRVLSIFAQIVYENICINLLLNISQVDCTAHTEVCGKYGVSGYPTLKIFKGGEMSEDYNGPREAGTVCPGASVNSELLMQCSALLYSVLIWLPSVL